MFFWFVQGVRLHNANTWGHVSHSTEFDTPAASCRRLSIDAPGSIPDSRSAMTHVTVRSTSIGSRSMASTWKSLRRLSDFRGVTQQLYLMCKVQGNCRTESDEQPSFKIGGKNAKFASCGSD